MGKSNGENGKVKSRKKNGKQIFLYFFCQKAKWETKDILLNKNEKQFFLTQKMTKNRGF